MSESKPRTHVVVTVYASERKNGAPLVHTYGPFTFSEAISRRRKMMNDFGAEMAAGILSVHTCKIIEDTL